MPLHRLENGCLVSFICSEAIFNLSCLNISAGSNTVQFKAFLRHLEATLTCTSVTQASLFLTETFQLF